MRGLDKFQMFALCEQRLASNGLRIDQVNLPEVARDRLSKISKMPSHPQSSVLMNDFTEKNSFFVFFQCDGRDVGCVSARMDDLGGEVFEDFWARTMRRWYGATEEFNVDTDHRLPINLSGKIVYIGDMHLADEFRGFKNIHLRAALYSMYLLSVDRWPDLSAIYALFMEKFALNGYLATYLAAETVMAPQLFQSEIPGRDDSDWLAILRPVHLAYYSRLFLDRPELFDSYRVNP